MVFSNTIQGPPGLYMDAQPKFVIVLIGQFSFCCNYLVISFDFFIHNNNKSFMNIIVSIFSWTWYWQLLYKQASSEFILRGFRFTTEKGAINLSIQLCLKTRLYIKSLFTKRSNGNAGISKKRYTQICDMQNHICAVHVCLL